MKRKLEFGPENQRTGDPVIDLQEILRRLNSTSLVEGSICFDACPVLPGDRSNVECPDGRLHPTYYEDLPALVAEFESQ